MPTLLEHVRRAYLVSTPLISISTPDAVSTVASVVKEIESIQDKNGKHGVSLQWDAVRGMTPASSRKANIKEATTAINTLSDNHPEALQNPVEVLNSILNVEKGSIVFLHNAHLLVAPEGKPAIDIVQGIFNLRDQFKRNQRMLVLLSPGMSMPRELANDVMTYEEPLPDADALKTVVRSVYEAAHEGEAPKATVVADAVEALAGLSTFTSEQVTAMSLTKDGLDVDGLWDRKKAMIDGTDGLSIWKPTTTLDDVIGCDNCTGYLDKLIDKKKINLVVWVDEIEKQLHGAEGESNGIVQDQVNVLLQEMQTNNYDGMMLIGLPGCGKSMIAQSTGTLTCQLDLGALMNSLVGESQSRLRQAMNIIKAVSGGNVLFIATSNSTNGLSPALMRRFKSGKFFFDLSNTKNLKAMWKHSLKGLNLGTIPNDEGWSPANIAVCVETAQTMDISLKDAAQYIVPEGLASAQSIEALRSQAEGVWISASEAGPYRRPEATSLKTITTTARKIDASSFGNGNNNIN